MALVVLALPLEAQTPSVRRGPWASPAGVVRPPALQVDSVPGDSAPLATAPAGRGALLGAVADGARRSRPGRSILAADTTRRPPAPWWAPVASILLPGAGQFALQQQRGAAYALLDVYAWLQYREAARDGSRAAARYRQIARDAARRPVAGGGSLPEAGWDYYEVLEKPEWIASGRYDAGTGAGFVPESADSTYNGYLWFRARELYFSDPSRPPAAASPAYQAAVAWYRARAHRPEYAWSWRDQQLLRDQYRRAIAQSNDAGRAATLALSVAVANRALSLVDAFATVRFRRFGPNGPIALSATLPWGNDAGAARTGR